ncbi:MAG: lipoprotein-anchoring transpeptidase ErfK/SrfK [Clostridium sp.]|jgi:lipoprotein-anchoring transpeptidase ErfK/SrfK
MPFNGGIGIHDANWRGSFGGNIYKTSGSHGCINSPYYLAKAIFNNIEAGIPVVCYN